jgi:hypothetical protein
MHCYTSTGHGGPNAADYVRSNLFINLLEHTKFNTDITSALGGNTGRRAEMASRQKLAKAARN